MAATKNKIAPVSFLSLFLCAFAVTAASASTSRTARKLAHHQADHQTPHHQANHQNQHARASHGPGNGPGPGNGLGLGQYGNEYALPPAGPEVEFFCTGDFSVLGNRMGCRLACAPAACCGDEFGCLQNNVAACITYSACNEILSDVEPTDTPAMAHGHQAEGYHYKSSKKSGNSHNQHHQQHHEQGVPHSHPPAEQAHTHYDSWNDDWYLTSPPHDHWHTSAPEPGYGLKHSKKGGNYYDEDDQYTFVPKHPGKGKGGYYEYVPGKGSVGKGSKKGYYPGDPKQSKKGKGYSKGGSSKGGSSKSDDGGVPHPSSAPHWSGVPSSSCDDIDCDPGSRPPASTREPTPSSVATAAPTQGDATPINLSNFVLEYTTSENRQAMRSEYNALTAITAEYLTDFMKNEFKDDTFTVLNDFVTRYEGSRYVMNAPILVEYSATARFADDDRFPVIPSAGQMDSLLLLAFQGENLIEYTQRLRDGLPDDNVFQDSLVFLTDDSAVTRVAKKSNGVGYASAAVALTLMVAGVVIYKRRQEDEEVEGMDPNKKAPCDITLAGETYAGETYDGTASVNASSVDYVSRQRDEEEGFRTNKLSAVKENTDGVSVSPVWGGNPMQDGDEEDEEVENAGNTAHKEHFAEIALQEPSYQNVLSQSDEEGDAASQANESVDSKTVNQIESLLSQDENDGQFSEDEQSSSSTRRPRTVAEIEAMLAADLGDDEDESHRVNDAESHESDCSSVESDSPRTVSEIASLLSVGLDDESSAASTNHS